MSANVVVRLKEKWGREYDEWNRRDLQGKEYVYLWADGIHANVRLEDEANKRQCMLVLMGTTSDGRKELVAVVDGFRESKQSWYELLLDLKQRGLTAAPKVAVGDGALGFWAALREVFGETCEQRCWFHKTGNILNRMPKSIHGKAKSDIHQIWMAETREEAYKAFDHFVEKYAAKYSEACECLKQDRDSTARVLRLPSRALEALENNQPNRVDVRNDSAPSSPHKRMRNQAGQPHDDVQVSQIRREEMAATKRTRANHLAFGRKEIRQRRAAGRRLTDDLKTRLLRISRTRVATRCSKHQTCTFRNRQSKQPFSFSICLSRSSVPSSQLLIEATKLTLVPQDNLAHCTVERRRGSARTAEMNGQISSMARLHRITC